MFTREITKFEDAFIKCLEEKLNTEADCHDVHSLKMKVIAASEPIKLDLNNITEENEKHFPTVFYDEPLKEWEEEEKRKRLGCINPSLPLYISYVGTQLGESDSICYCGEVFYFQYDAEKNLVIALDIWHEIDAEYGPRFDEVELKDILEEWIPKFGGELLYTNFDEEDN